MNSPGPLDTMDPNVTSRQPNGKPKAAQQPTSQAPVPFDRKGSEAPVSETATSGAESLPHVMRPSLTGMPSFQRPRKRVIWRNKACFVALPLEDGFGRRTGRKSYLSPNDFEKRLEDWKNHGFDTSGFTLAPEASDLDSPLEGQSRAVHPDPEDEKRERANGSYRVSIPDQRHWVRTSPKQRFCSRPNLPLQDVLGEENILLLGSCQENTDFTTLTGDLCQSSEGGQAAGVGR